MGLPVLGAAVTGPIIKLCRWFKNGDHPADYAKDQEGIADDGQLVTFTGAERKARGWEGAVVRYYRHPQFAGDRPCAHCGALMHDHGWIDSGGDGRVVCPGDWLFTGRDGGCYPVKPEVADQVVGADR
jgi:hypothetical protein